MRRSGAVLRSAAALLALSLHSAAHSPIGRSVLCDRIAADPTDPDKPKDVKGARGNRAIRCRDRDQILQGRVGVVAPRDVSARPRLCRQPANRRKRLAAYRKAADKGSSVGHGRARRDVRHRRGRRRDQAKARELFERAAKAGNPRGVTNLAAIDGGARVNPPRRAPCWRRRPRRIPRKRSSSSA